MHKQISPKLRPQHYVYLRNRLLLLGHPLKDSAAQHEAFLKTPVGRHVLDCDNLFCGSRFEKKRACLKRYFGDRVWWQRDRGLPPRQTVSNYKLPSEHKITPPHRAKNGFPQHQTVFQTPEENLLNWKQIWVMRWGRESNREERRLSHCFPRDDGVQSMGLQFTNEASANCFPSRCRGVP